MKNYSEFALDRDEIIWEIRQRCMKEMYARAQPSEDYDKIWEYYKQCKKEGKEGEQVYRRYYLSVEEFKYIEEKYLELYKIIDPFKEHCDIIIRDMKEGCSKDKYIPEYTDEHGNWHPGYSGYEKVPSLEKQIGKEAAKKVIDFVEQRRDFYRFNRDENAFRFSVALSDSPTSNAQEVIDYWKSQGKDIEIDPRHHNSDYFWREEHGYLEEGEYESDK